VSRDTSTENNGLALCVLHHKAFDLGVFTVDAQGLLLVSDHANGTGLDEHFMRYHKQGITQPRNSQHHPDPNFLDWHKREVFKGKPLP
jgi:putative restriction endonuclease